MDNDTEYARFMEPIGTFACGATKKEATVFFMNCDMKRRREEMSEFSG